MDLELTFWAILGCIGLAWLVISLLMGEEKPSSRTKVLRIRDLPRK
jgi:hypothetical protein